MSFSKRTLAALCQLLDSLSQDSAYVLLQKAGVGRPQYSGQESILWELERANESAVRDLLTDIAVRTRAVRADAGTKYVFEDRLEELWRCLRLDGWELVSGKLIREHPSSPDLVETRDALHDELTASTRDTDGEIRRCLEQSAIAFSNIPPDYNASSTHVRIALETTGRRIAHRIAARRKLPPPQDSWGRAIAFLREQDVISEHDEAALTASYTATSPGAHVPKGLSAREWARMVRALDQAWLYYLVKRETA
jgi:hypothetical protein